MCKNIFLHPFFLSMVKETKSWVCQLPKALLLVANEPLLRSPKQLKACFLQNCNQPPNHPLSVLLLIFQNFFRMHRVWKNSSTLGCLWILKAHCCLYQGFQCRISLRARVGVAILQLQPQQYDHPIQLGVFLHISYIYPFQHDIHPSHLQNIIVQILISLG